jgi:hypothetical protein
MEVDGGGGRRRDLDLGGGIRSPSSLSLASAAVTVIPNRERRDSKRSGDGGDGGIRYHTIHRVTISDRGIVYHRAKTNSSTYYRRSHPLLFARIPGNHL